MGLVIEQHDGIIGHGSGRTMKKPAKSVKINMITKNLMVGNIGLAFALRSTAGSLCHSRIIIFQRMRQAHPTWAQHAVPLRISTRPRPGGPGAG